LAKNENFGQKIKILTKENGNLPENENFGQKN